VRTTHRLCSDSGGLSAWSPGVGALPVRRAPHLALESVEFSQENMSQ
jgi:hypothetical protein